MVVHRVPPLACDHCSCVGAAKRSGGSASPAIVAYGSLKTRGKHPPSSYESTFGKKCVAQHFLRKADLSNMWSPMTGAAAGAGFRHDSFHPRHRSYGKATTSGRSMALSTPCCRWASRCQRQQCRVDSTGQRNTFAEHLSGRVEAERLARPLVQLSRDRVELELRIARDIDTLRYVLPEQAIGVLVAS